MEAKRVSLPFFRVGRSRVLARARAILTSTWTLGGLVFATTWAGGAVAPWLPPSIDSSAHAGLQLAAVDGLDFGTDIVFTYGPLGFLKSYFVFEPWPSRLATLYGLALHLALSLSLVWVARRSFPLVLAVLFAFVGAALMRGDITGVAVRDDAGVVVLALVWCVVALGTDAPSWTRRLLVFGGGPYAALEILGKLSTGLMVLALVAIGVLAIEEDRRRNVTILATTFAASLAALWFAAGQSLGNFDNFVISAMQTISGYSSGAVFDWNSRQYDYFLAPAVIALTAAICWYSTRQLPSRQRVAGLVIFAVIAFAAWKVGFVAHEPFHMGTFFGMMLGTCLAFAFWLPPRREIRIGAAIAITGVIAASYTNTFPGFPISAEMEPTYGPTGWTPNPVVTVRNGAETLATIVDTSRLADQIAQSRADLRADYGLDRRTLELVDEHAVHIDPSEVAAAWAYRLDWHPLPSFQPYSAWTPELDEQNAEAIASPDGPERILRQNLNALGRYPGWESPAAMIEMLCNFRPLRTTSSWQVLERIPDRCGEPKPLETVTGTFSAPILVPKPPRDSVVFGRVQGVQISGREDAKTFLERARHRQVAFDTVSGEPASTLTTPPYDGRFVFIPGTAENGLVFRASPGVDYPDPFAIAPDAEAVTFYLDRSDEAHDPITIEFFSMPVRPWRSSHRR
jgi:hypothetical protein